MTQAAMFPRASSRPCSSPGEELLIDNFAGGGGASTGIELAMGRSVDIAINHDAEALAMHAANHPHTLHLREDVWSVDPVAVCKGRPVGLAWFSPDCKHHSRARGSKPKAKPLNKRIRALAWVAVKWAKAVRPRVICLENVREFEEWGPLDEKQMPCKRRKGQTFQRFVAMLRNLGYRVDWRVLNAADFGHPTHRRRLFLVARRDALSIRWPAPTHGNPKAIKADPHLQPHRPISECIEWQLPCRSIFGRKKPLAEKTMRRIAIGIKRFVLDNPHPFRGQSVGLPMGTLTAKHGYGLVMPFMASVAHTKSTGRCKHVNDIQEPIRTITAGNDKALIAAHLTHYHSGECQAKRNRASSPDDPIPTQDTSNRFGLVSAFITKFYGTNVGSDVRHPLPTITGQGQHLGEVRAFLIKYFGTAIGQPVDDSLHTITAKPRFGLVTVAGQEYEIADIGLRMLNPRELARAQYSPELAEDLILPRTTEAAVAKLGNSVCPLVAAALVRANMIPEAAEAVA